MGHVEALRSILVKGACTETAARSTIGAGLQSIIVVLDVKKALVLVHRGEVKDILTSL